MSALSHLSRTLRRIGLNEGTSGRALRWLGRSLSLLPRKRSHPDVSFYPAFNSEQEFLDAYHKARFFLAPEIVDEVVMNVVFTPTFNLDSPSEWPLPPYVADIPLGHASHIRVRKGRVSFCRSLLNSDYVFIWDWRCESAWLRMLHRSPKFVNVDRHTSRVEGWVWPRFLSSLRSQHDLATQRAQAQQRFLDYIGALPHYSKAYVFGTGPSLEDAWRYRFSDGYRIVCNSIVKNESLLNHIDPHFILAGDAIHHFGNNRHAYEFRRDLEKALLTLDAVFMTRDIFYPLLVRHHPAVAGRVIPAMSGIPGLHLDMKRQLIYNEMGNILTSLMLPLASSLADDTYMLGFDGRAPDDELFWSHSASTSYQEAEDSLRAAHPGFFQIDYREYAAEHAKNTERILSAGERRGKRYHCLNHSYVPALEKRFLSSPEGYIRAD